MPKIKRRKTVKKKKKTKKKVFDCIACEDTGKSSKGGSCICQIQKIRS